MTGGRVSSCLHFYYPSLV